MGDKAILDLAAALPSAAGAEQEAIRSTLHMTRTQYFRRLNLVIDTEAALAYAPMLVRRLRARREGRVRTPGQLDHG